MIPECCDVCGVVGVPVLVLRAGQGVQVDDRVDALAAECINGAVEVAEAVGLDLERSRVVLEVLVSDGDSRKIQPGIAEEHCVPLIEEPGEEPLEEALGPVITDRSPYLPPHQRLVRRVAGDEVLHVEPAAETDPTKPQRPTVGAEELRAGGLYHAGPCSHPASMELGKFRGM